MTTNQNAKIKKQVNQVDEYTLKLSKLLNISIKSIINYKRTTVFTSKDLYDFYCLTNRIPTSEEISAASRIGAKLLLFIIAKLNH